MTADGYLRSVLADGARAFRFRPGVARLLGHVCADIDLVFVAAPSGQSFPPLRPGAGRDRHLTLATYGDGDYLLPDYTENLAAQANGLTTGHTPSHDVTSRAAAPAPTRSDAAAERSIPPATAEPAPDPTETIVVPPIATRTPSARMPEPAHQFTGPTPISGLVAQQNPLHPDIGRPPPEPQTDSASTIVPAPAEPLVSTHAPHITVSSEAAWTKSGVPQRVPSADYEARRRTEPDPVLTTVPAAAKPITPSNPPHVTVPGDAAPIKSTIPQRAPWAGHDAGPKTERGTELDDEPQAVTPHARRVTTRHTRDSALTRIDAAPSRPIPDDRAEPTTEPAPASPQPMAEAPVIVVEDNAPVGVSGFWVRKYLSRLRPGLLR